jgi:RHS repeat-associated protein
MFRRSVVLSCLLLCAVIAWGAAPPSVATHTTSGSWESGTFAYDGSGNIIEIGDDVYTYDTLRRLIYAEIMSGGAVTSDTYQYDGFGNLHLRTTAGASGTSQLPIPVDWWTNRLAEASYDDAGNVLNSGGAASHSYSWDSMRMLSSRDAGQETYIYTPSDERIAVRKGTQWTWSLRDTDGRLLRQMESTEGGAAWTWREDFVHRNGQVAGSERRGSGRRHFHNDHLGSARLITAHDGQAVSRHDFLPFGIELTSIRQEQARGEAGENVFRFAGHERDFTGGTLTENTDTTDYMHARYYRSMTGRFLSPDPGRDQRPASGQSWNRYTYARNNPITYIDPDGRYVAVARNLQPEIAKTYANSPTFRRVYDAVHGNHTLLQKLTLGNVRLSGVRAETNEQSRGAIVSNGQVQYDANGKLMVGITMLTVLPPGNIGKKAGHELQHGVEFGQYGRPSDAPDARSSAGGNGVETQTALDVERQIATELAQSGGQNSLTPEEQAALFSVPADCTTDKSKCPALQPTPPVTGQATPPQ